MKKTFSILAFVSLTVILISVGVGESGVQRGPQTFAPAQNNQTIRINADYGKMPLYFIPNQGQMDKQVAYYVQGKDKTIYFTPGGITFALTKPSSKDNLPAIPGVVTSSQDLLQDKIEVSEAGFNEEKAGPGHAMEGGPERGRRASSERWVVKLEFVGSDKSVKPVGESETGAVVSYFKGKPKDWKTGIPTYSKIVYPNRWPGIDLVYYGTVNRLKYEFIVHPGADPSKIRLAYRGAESVSVDGEGRLNVATPAGGFTDDVPVAYQEIGGKRVDIKLAYKMGVSANQVDEVALACRAILNYEIGPGFSSAATDGAIAGLTKLDGAGGNLEIKACSYGFELGAYDPSLPLVLDPAILVYCGYIGGSSDDEGYGIAVDGSGNAYVTGFIGSAEATFPVAVGPDLTYNGGTYDAFVTKVNPTGTALVYCGYIGGSRDDEGLGIAVDGSGNACVTGYTYSTEATFPVTVGPDLTFNNTSGLSDAFVAKVNASGTTLVYCGYIGGSSIDDGYGIAVDGSGNAYVTGYTYSTEATFPVTVGPDLTFNGDVDAFVAKVNAAGTALFYCGYIGGASATWGDYGYGIAVDGSGNAYVTGDTYSTEATFPVAVGPDLTQNGVRDAFVAKISYWDVWAAKHAVGDFDGDGAKEVAVDFGVNGIYLYNNGNWTQLAPENPESLMATDIDGDSVDEILADLGSLGLWLWNAGAWNQLSGVNIESMAVGDVDADGSAEVVGDFGAVGLWLYNGGVWTQLSGVNTDYVTVANADGAAGDEIFGDFGAAGLWVWNTGTWSILSGLNADYVMTGLQTGARFVLGDFGPTGLWLWSMPGLCTQLSGLNADYMIAANTDGDTEDEIIGDFGGTGLWHCEGGPWTGPGFTWTILSGVNADFMIRADVDANGTDEVAADFGTLGLWLWNAGSWSQISGANAEYHLAADVDGDNKDEILADFGSLGLWLWNEGSWGHISANNPE